MGYASKKRSQRRISGLTQQIESPSKRRLVIGALAAGALAVGGGIVYFSHSQNDRWAFLDCPWIGDRRLGDERPIQSYVPISTEINGGIETIIEELLPDVQNEITKHNIAPSSVRVSTQYYVVPERIEYALQLAEYAKIAANFLNANIKGLVNTSIDWIVVKDGDNYNRIVAGKGFIGNNFFYLQTLKDNDGNLLNTLWYNVRSGLNWAEYIIISTGEFALSTPISETLHITTRRRINLANSRASDFAINEAATEGMALVLTERFAKEIGIPNYQARVEGLRRNGFKGPQYRFVAVSERWIRENGIQNAFDLYMEGPEKFLEAITSGKS